MIGDKELVTTVLIGGNAKVITVADAKNILKRLDDEVACLHNMECMQCKCRTS